MDQWMDSYIHVPVPIIGRSADVPLSLPAPSRILRTGVHPCVDLRMRLAIVENRPHFDCADDGLGRLRRGRPDDLGERRPVLAVPAPPRIDAPATSAPGPISTAAASATICPANLHRDCMPDAPLLHRDWICPSHIVPWTRPVSLLRRLGSPPGLFPPTPGLSSPRPHLRRD